MAPGVTLQPFAAKVLWSSVEGLRGGEWGILFAGFAEEIARRAIAEGALLIGHIKGIASPEAGGYLHVSAVSPTHAACVQGQVPDGLREMTLDLNVLVYGLSPFVVRAIVDKAAQARGRSRGCSVSVEPTNSHSCFDELHFAEKIQ